MALSKLQKQMKAIADAIREKCGETCTIKCCDFPNKIKAMSMPPKTESGMYVLSYDSGTNKPVSVELWGRSYTGELASEGKLDLVIYGEGITAIGASSCNDSSVTRVILPTTLETIGASAFASCNSLSKVELSDGTQRLPDGVTAIPASCFSNCKFTTLELPDGIESIGNKAFQNSTYTISKLPLSLKTVGQYAFSKIGSATFTEIPAGVTTLDLRCFEGNGGLTSITFKGKPNSINSYAFSTCSNITVINCPWAEGAVANAPWGASNAVINYNYTEEE